MARSDYSVYLHTLDVAAIEAAFDELFAAEQYSRVRQAHPDVPGGYSPPLRDAWSNRDWAVPIAPGRAGWSVAKTTPPTLLCEQPPDERGRLLARLAQRLGCDVFQ